MWHEAFFDHRRGFARPTLLGLIGGVSIAWAAGAAPLPLSSVLASPVEGAWKTQNGTEITIAPCDAGFCGTLSWVVIPKEHSAECEKDKAGFGALMLDYQNPKMALKLRQIVGMQMMTLVPTSDPNTFNATIYNVEDGRTYEGTAAVLAQNTLRLGNGCVMNDCAASQDWPRVPPRPNAPDFTCRPE